MKKAHIFILSLALLFGMVYLSVGQQPTIMPVGPITVDIVFKEEAQFDKDVHFEEHVAINNNKDLRFYDNSNYVGFKSPALTANQIWTLPTADGTSGYVLRTNGSGVLSWSGAGLGGGELTAAIDVDAVAGYLGAASNDGILRSGTGITYTDGGNYITLTVTEADIESMIDTLGNIQFNGTITTGSDGTGHDVKLWSATESSYWLWDEDADSVVQAMVAGETTENEYAYTINVTDATAASEDMHKGLQVAYAQSGAKTGSAHIEGVGADITLTNNTPQTAAFAAYITANNRDDTLGYVTGMDIYIEDMGTGVGNLWGLQIGINGTNQAATDHCGIEIRTHGGTIKDAILLTVAAVDGIDMSASTFSTADFKMQNSETISNASDGTIEYTGFHGSDLYDNGSKSGAFTIDWKNGNYQKVTITGALLDITFTEPGTSGRCILWITQGDGSDTLDWTHEVNPEWPGGVAPTLSTGSGDVDVIGFFFAGGTTYRGLFNGNFTT